MQLSRQYVVEKWNELGVIEFTKEIFMLIQLKVSGKLEMIKNKNIKPDQRRKEWLYYYSSSDSSRSRRVRSFTSRRPPSSTSSDLDTRMSYFPIARAAAAFV